VLVIEPDVTVFEELLCGGVSTRVAFCSASGRPLDELSCGRLGASLDAMDGVCEGVIGFEIEWRGVVPLLLLIVGAGVALGSRLVTCGRSLCIDLRRNAEVDGTGSGLLPVICTRHSRFSPEDEEVPS
jgi:hypothetical protein